MRPFPKHQAGLTFISLLLLLLVIGFFATVTIKCLPLYLNQMKVSRSLHAIAEDAELSSSDAVTIREHLHRRWLIDSVDGLRPEDVKVRRSAAARSLVYAYEARTSLFYNIDLVIRFSGDVPIRLPSIE